LRAGFGEGHRGRAPGGRAVQGRVGSGARRAVRGPSGGRDRSRGLFPRR
jgi:hypothetical protein